MMKPPAGQFPISYDVYQDADGEEMVRLLWDAFTRHEPLALAVELKPEEFALFVQALLPKAAQEGLTIVARDRQSGEMVGAVLTNDPAGETDAAIGTWSRKFQMVGSILGRLGTMYRAGREPVAGEALHLYLLGVSDQAAGMGVGRQLVAAAVENGARRGYRVAIAEATSRKSQHIFRELGFAERAQILYGDYLFEGEHVFAGIAEQGGPILMEKMLKQRSMRRGPLSCVTRSGAVAGAVDDQAQ
jgi:ribosomal protein S18 acetylase RimI-like enzyme